MTWTIKQAEALAAVFLALNKNDIQWMVLRNHEGLPEINTAKDVDIIMDKKNFSKARDVICNTLSLIGFTHIEETVFECIRCYTFYNTNSLETYSIKIDLFYDFVWRGAQVISFQSLYEKKVLYKNFYVLDSLSDGFLIWIKPLMTGGFIKEKYRADILKAITIYPEQFHTLLMTTFGNKLSKQLWSLLQQSDLDATVPYQRTMCYTAWRKSFFNRPSQTIIATLDHFYKEILRRSHSPPASMFAVVGPDGVGKSTFIEILQKELIRLLIRDADGVIIEHFRPNILPNLKKLFSDKTYDETQEVFTSPHRATPARPVSSLLRLGYYWLDYVLGYWLITRKSCVGGKVYIFDRYFYDFIADPFRSRIKLPDWIRLFFLKMTPEPDVVFFLNCDAVIVFQRKQELTLTEIERQLQVYQSLAAKNNRFVTLAAQQSPQTLCNEALKCLVEKSFSRLSQTNA